MTQILIIDDESTVRKVVTEILKLKGYQTLEAQDGEQGFEMIQDNLPDLILCDINMPKLNGLELLKRLQQDRTTATIPFIFLSGNDTISEMRQGMSLGANDYIMKPFNANDLLVAIKTQLDKYKLFKAQSQESMATLRKNISLALPHELKTPLTILLGYSQLLLSHDDFQADEIKLMGQGIYKNAIRLEHLIENYLLYANLEIWAQDPEKEPIQSISTEFNPTSSIMQIAQKKAHEYAREDDLMLQLTPGNIYFTEGYFAKIVDELIDNAFKFSPPGTPVEVLSQFKSNTFQFSVSDRGRGIKPEYIPQIGAYMQFERKLYEQQGSGMGLALVKRLTEIHGGHLAIDHNPDAGITVTVFLQS